MGAKKEMDWYKWFWKLDRQNLQIQESIRHQKERRQKIQQRWDARLRNREKDYGEETEGMRLDVSSVLRFGADDR